MYYITNNHHSPEFQRLPRLEIYRNNFRTISVLFPQLAAKCRAFRAVSSRASATNTHRTAVCCQQTGVSIGANATYSQLRDAHRWRGRDPLIADIKYTLLIWTNLPLNETYRARYAELKKKKKKTGERFRQNLELAARDTDLVDVLLYCGVDNDPAGG